MSIPICPHYNVPPFLENGLWNPVWYEYLQAIGQMRLLDLADVDTASLANGDSPVYNSSTEKFEMVAN